MWNQPKRTREEPLRHCGLALLAAVISTLLSAQGATAAPANGRPGAGSAADRSYAAEGVVKEVKADGRTLVVSHEAIPDYMPAMTMPFRAGETNELAGLRAGDRITFRLHVTDTQSWIDHITWTGQAQPAGELPGTDERPAASAPRPENPLKAYHFTNELGQAVSLDDFRGQALAITFFFTRCPIPDYCPRLSKNFEQATRKLAALPDAPTNWHFLSVTFDPEYDTPAVLKAYAAGYHYDPSRWSFLTGPRDKIGELASGSDVTFKRDGAFISHNFRTLVIDANGRLQMMFPVAGDFSDALVDQVLKGARAVGQPERPRRPSAVAVAGH